MRFQTFINEDYEQVRDYKKAIFDLKVEMAELDFWKGEKVPKDNDKKRLHLQRGVAIKEKIIALKEKIVKSGSELGEAAKMPEGLQDVLDSIPDKDSEEAMKLKKTRKNLGGA